MLINGRWLSAKTGKSFNSYNPANGEIVGIVAEGDESHAIAGIDAAHNAFTAWSQTTAYERANFLMRAADNVLDRQDEIAALMCVEQGKPRKSAINEVRYAADFLRWYAEEAKRICGTTIPSARADQRFVTVQSPVGVVAAITPWNYPVSMITRKLAPALAAGCTLVLKPAEATSLCAIAMFKAINDAGLPEGVVNLITTSDPKPIGQIFVTDPRVNKITFTGSTSVGRYLAGEAGKSMKRISLELGGHAPFIVFPDANPVHAAKGAALVKFLNTGQACISPNRIFVHESIYSEFIDTLHTRTKSLVVGSGVDEGVSIGPLVSESAVLKVEAQVNDAVEKGASVVTGGQRLQSGGFELGNFYAPTVIRDITPEMKIYRQETFGPVAAVMSFTNQDDVFSMANDTNYGLAAYVYTNTISTMYKAMEKLRFGIIGINDINPTSAAAPFGGMNDSGLGREGGAEGMQEYLETKSVGISVS